MTVPRHRVGRTYGRPGARTLIEPVRRMATATSHRLGLYEPSGVVAASPAQPREGAQCVVKRYRPTPNRCAPSLPPPRPRRLRGRSHRTGGTETKAERALPPRRSAPPLPPPAHPRPTATPRVPYPPIPDRRPRYGSDAGSPDSALNGERP